MYINTPVNTATIVCFELGPNKKLGHENSDPDQNLAANEQSRHCLLTESWFIKIKNEKYHPTTTKREISCQISAVYGERPACAPNTDFGC